MTSFGPHNSPFDGWKILPPKVLATVTELREDWASCWATASGPPLRHTWHIPLLASDFHTIRISPDLLAQEEIILQLEEYPEGWELAADIPAAAGSVWVDSELARKAPERAGWRHAKTSACDWSTANVRVTRGEEIVCMSGSRMQDRRPVSPVGVWGQAFGFRVWDPSWLWSTGKITRLWAGDCPESSASLMGWTTLG